MREPAPRHGDPDDLRGVVWMSEREWYRPADTPEAAEFDNYELVLDSDDPPQALLVSGNHPITIHSLRHAHSNPRPNRANLRRAAGGTRE
jgi:hypothetical protein